MLTIRDFRVDTTHQKGGRVRGRRVITFGYHSVSMGRSRGFEVSEICIMSHGGAIHDTIATVEDRQKDLC
jgi:hypothetical protein